MIGDREHDVLGARANGIRAIAVTYGYGSREELVGSKARCHVRTAAGPDPGGVGKPGWQVNGY